MGLRLLGVVVCVIVVLGVVGLLAVTQRSHNEHILVDPDRNRFIVYRVWPGIGDGPRPLILLSHGSGGDYRNHLWLVTALQASGYSVAALNHPFDTTRNRTPEGVTQLQERPQDVTALLDLLLGSPTWAPTIDPSRIGAAGFSSGGYTALALAGAVYNGGLMRQYCESDRRAGDCDLAPVSIHSSESVQRSVADPRIKAVFAMAPAVGQGIELPSLETIEVPVFIIAANDDEIVPPQLNAHVYQRHIPGAESTLIDRGGHFVFLRCDFATGIADLFIRSLNLCGRGIDVDRKAIQDDVAHIARDFFDQKLSRPDIPGKI